MQQRLNIHFFKIHIPRDQLFQNVHMQPGLISASSITLRCSSRVVVSQVYKDSLMVICQKYCQGSSSSPSPVSGGASQVEEAGVGMAS